jgi:hypothetical protein
MTVGQHHRLGRVKLRDNFDIAGAKLVLANYSFTTRSLARSLALKTSQTA